MKLFAESRMIGADILLAVWGGTQPHIGSVVISVPRQSLADSTSTSITSSVYNFSGHKDEAIAKIFAEAIAVACKRTTVVTAGFHLDNLKKEDIQQVLRTAEKLSSRLSKNLLGAISASG
ncbi:hypothetical protein ACFL43_04540 [Thermodesulfobacteriota bacterium]